MSDSKCKDKMESGITFSKYNEEVLLSINEVISLENDDFFNKAIYPQLHGVYFKGYSQKNKEISMGNRY